MEQHGKEHSSANSLFGDLLDQFVKIVGPEAGKATFHYASVQEGMRLAEGLDRELPMALSRIDAVVGHRSKVILETPELVRIRVMDSPLLNSGDAVRQGVVLGLLEGMLRVTRGRPFVGTIVPDAKVVGCFQAELRRQAAP